jgi:uncharacterized protein YndB with AHSA1/START domain
MARAYTSTVIDAPADQVWDYLRDFNGLPKWTGGIVATSEIEDGRSGDQVGSVRSFTLPDGTHLRERLLSHSDTQRAYSYNFEKTPFDVDHYHATLKVSPVTDGAKSFVEWWTTFDSDRDKIDYWEGFFANEIFQNALNAVKEHFGS